MTTASAFTSGAAEVVRVVTGGNGTRGVPASWLDEGVSVRAWVEDRLPTSLVHLDAAAAGRLSRSVLEAQVRHLHREAELGAYVAEAQADLGPGRAALGALVGLAGDDVFLTSGTQDGFQVLLDAWPLPPGARIGTVPGEFGGHARVLETRARRQGWEVVLLPVDGLGRVLDMPAGLDLVTLPQVASQRGVVQPVDFVLDAGPPVLLDVAQSAGHVPVPAGAAAYVGTARKWLCGPRGVGWAAVAPAWQERLAPAPTLTWLDGTAMARYDAPEGHVAARVALAEAARAWSPALMPVIAAAGGAARVLLQGAGGWQVVEPVEEPTGITTLRHATADPVATRDALRAEGFLTAAVPRHRAADLDGPLLRVSTHAWVDPGQLEALAAALDRSRAE
jgi:pyridoxal 5-phosphate dependent beta-lyase